MKSEHAVMAIVAVMVIVYAFSASRGPDDVGTDRVHEELENLRRANRRLQRENDALKSSGSPPSLQRENWFKELIPSSLRKDYQIHCDDTDPVQGGKGFNITEAMLRKTRPIVGNTQSLHKTLRKLRDRECLVIYVFGGSVTAGHNGGGLSASYSTRFLELLNTKYQCLVTQPDGTETQGQHRRVLPDYSGLTSSVILDNLNAIFPPNAVLDHRIDLVLVEFNVNDHFLPNPPQIRSAELDDSFDRRKPRIQDFVDGSPKEMEYVIRTQWWTEAVIRMFLQLPLTVYPEGHEDRHIGSIPLVMFHADHRHFYLKKGGSGAITQYLSLSVYRYYEIPTISAVEAYFPLYQISNTKFDWKPVEARSNKNNLRFMANNSMYSMSNYHADACCHPLAFGHRFLSMVLLYNLEKEMQIMADMEREAGVDPTDSEFNDYHIIGPIEKFREFWLPSPWRMTKHEDAMYCKYDGIDSFINFMQSGPAVDLDRVIANNDGEAWSFYADSKNKTGLITTTAPSHVSLKVTIVGPHNLLKVFYLQSWDRNNTATALMWADNTATNRFSSSYCSRKEQDLKKMGFDRESPPHEHSDEIGKTTVFTINSHKGGEASIGVDKSYPNVLPAAKYLHFCVLQKEDEDEGIKFKLLSVSSKSNKG